mmetsp:Transcript_126309/g.351960  ORF Transcript_126309/g.351960 Transcript_126309/m.351960 type:complete len:271 (-) Transcript_126309:1677-2489(-)
MWHLVLRKQTLNSWLFGLWNLSDQHRLVARHAEAAATLELLGDFCQANAHLILDTANGHKATAMPKAIICLHPAVQITPVFELVRALRLELLPESVLHLLTVPIWAVVLHGVLDAGMLAICAVSKVALHGHHNLAHVLRVTRQAESDDLGEPGEGLLVVVCEAETAANCDIEALQLAALNYSNEANAMREDVNIVGRWDGHCNLELAREVRLPVERLLLDRGAAKHLGLLGHLIAVHEEYLVVSPCPWQAMVVDRVCVAQNLVHELGAAH